MELKFGAGEPLVSVVTVFNRPEVLERCLLATLRRQSGASFEWIGVDNSGSAYGSAALALNAGARRASGSVLLFTHQDVSLHGERWIAELARWMEELADAGVAGVVGPRASDGTMIGYMRDRRAVTGHPLAGPCEVQTLDECVLAMRREVFERHPFDESIGGWHVYGVDACLRTRRAGLRTYVLPLFVHHDSAAVNMAGLAEAHDRIHREHGAGERVIYTTCGVVVSRRARLGRRLRRACRRGVRRAADALGLPAAHDHLTLLQRLAEGSGRVLVLDFFPGEASPTWPTEVEVEAMDGKARSAVPVLHRVLLPGDSPAGVLGRFGAGEAPGAVFVYNLQCAAPGQLRALRSSLSAPGARVWAVYPAPERNAVRRGAEAEGWSVAGERATRPFTGPAPVYVAELR